jgi:hypothetical protein
MFKLPKLFNLKHWELQKKYESIKFELETWETLTAENQPLEKHYRQVRRLSKELTGMIDVVGTEMKALQGDVDLPSFLHQLRRVEFLILEIHRTWHYFRQKLAARQGPPFGELLEALDEFVWACYQPAFANLKRIPEPPLTFFSSEWSPAASSRHEFLPLEQTADLGTGPYGQGEELAGKRLKTLVIPVISLPWFQTTFLPEALLLAHETAHLLEYELHLTDNIIGNLRAAAIEQGRLEKYWLPWSAEVFADLYAVLHLGPAFVAALSLLLSRSTETVLRTPDPKNRYPPHHLRMLIAFSALKHISSGAFATDAKRLEESWDEAYGDSVPGKSDGYKITDYVLSECVQDIEEVVKALLDKPFDALGGKPFKDLKHIPWTRQEQSAALLVCNSLLHKDRPLQGERARILLAGAQLAFLENPEGLLNGGRSRQKTQADLIHRIVSNRTPGTRGRYDPTPLPQLNQQTDESDKVKGRDVAHAMLAEFEKYSGENSTRSEV